MICAEGGCQGKRSGRLNSSVFWGLVVVPVEKQGVIITQGGMEDGLVVILRLGGAGTHSKHFPEERKEINTKASPTVGLSERPFIALILLKDTSAR